MAKGHGPWKYTARDGTVSWHIRVELPPDPLTGERRRQGRSYRTQRLAQSALRQWLQEIEQGTVILDADITVADYMQHWLTLVKARIQPRTYQSYEQIVRTHIVPALGHLRLQRLDRSHAEALYARLLADGGRKDGKPGPLSRRMVRMVHDVLKRACEEARRAGIRTTNPLDDLKPPKAEARRIDCWTPREAATFLAATEGDYYGAIWVVALRTGLRVGELLGLRWEDCALSIPRPELRVRQVLQDQKGTLSIKPVPKSDSGTRAVALTPATVAALSAHRTAQIDAAQRAATWPHPELVFPAPSTGTLMQPRNLTRHFQGLWARAGVKRIRIHDLRHTHATLLMLAGVNPKVVSERLGHKDVAFTLRVYSHVLPQMQTDAAAAFDATILEAAEKCSATRRPHEPKTFAGSREL